MNRGGARPRQLGAGDGHPGASDTSLLRITLARPADLTTREHIFRAALETFAEHGYEASSLRTIAAKVGIEAPSLYNHITSKQDLLFGLIQQATLEMIEHVEAEIAGVGDDPVERLHAVVQAHVVFHCRYRAHVVVGDAELRSLTDDNFGVTRTQRRRYEQIFTDVLSHGADRGVFRAGDVRVIAYGIMAMGTSAARWYRPDGRMAPEQIGELYADLCVAAVRVTP